MQKQSGLRWCDCKTFLKRWLHGHHIHNWIKVSGLRDAAQVSAITSQLTEFGRALGNIVDGSQQPITQLTGLHNRFSITLEDFWKQLQLIGKYNWDFDHYLEEDMPTAVR